MGKPALLDKEIKKIIHLRETGHSLLEIKGITKRGFGTVSKYAHNIPILPPYQNILLSKQGGSIKRSKEKWEISRKQAFSLIGSINTRDRMIILSSLYWGEGNKKELNLINGDPFLVKTFVICLRDLNISNKQLKVSIRLFEDIDRKKAINFWSGLLALPKSQFTRFEIIKGKKKGKLKYGMCRVRVGKGGDYFKLIMSVIDLIRSNITENMPS